MRFESTGFQKSTFVDLPNDFLHFVVPVDVALRDRTAVNLLRRFLPRSVRSTVEVALRDNKLPITERQVYGLHREG